MSWTDTSCEIWPRGKNSAGYGVLYLSSQPKLAHRHAWELRNGPIPVGLELDHLCRNPACINPEHLEAVSHAENMRRGNAPAVVIARTGKCHVGHPFNSENTYLSRDGRKHCRVCRRIRRRAQREKAA